METGRILHFAAGLQRLALPLSEVREIAEVRSLVSVHGAPAIVGGLAEIRGRVVTVLDPATGGAAPEAGPAQPSAPLFAVIFREPFDHLGVLVRGVPETADALEVTDPAESGGRPGAGSWIAEGREILLSGGRRASLLEPRRLADHASRCVRAQFMVVS